MISDPTTLRRFLFGALCLAALSPELRPADPQTVEARPVDLQAAVKRVRPAFMLLHAEHRELRYGIAISEPTTTPFSGILFDARGYILTMGQAIQGAEMISAEDHQGQIRLCEPIGYDPGSGVGVLRISPPGAPDAPGDLEHALPEFLEAEPPEVGQPIFSLGNPCYLGTSLSVGYVTGTGRTLESEGHEWSNLMQLSLAVNPGDQGGPLADREGRVVGMVLTRYRPPEFGNLREVEVLGISFGLPIGDALTTARQLVEMYDRQASLEDAGERQPWVGVRVSNLESPSLLAQLRLEPKRAVLVESVFRDSPAELAGLERNDVIVEFDAKRLAGLQHFGELIVKSGAGSRVPVIVIRAGERRTLELVIGQRRAAAKR